MTTKINSGTKPGVREHHIQRNHMTHHPVKSHERGGATKVGKAKNSGLVGTALRREPVVVSFSSNSRQRALRQPTNGAHVQR